MRVVIVGSGRLGSSVAMSLEKEGHQVTIVDEVEAKFRNLESPGSIRKLTGNIFNEEILEQAFGDKTDVAIVVTGKDNVNIMIGQIIKLKRNVGRVVVRIFDPPLAEVYQKLGIETVCPTNFALANIINLIIK
ncbi:MAG: TrkA family potassium uptake protein [Nitrospirae bacterium]|nr:TrkA family potassium uptake protein [Nitrospirota bacterium]MBI3352515.1 TrkA family potassium uptake protein [Nitrospirota bacterium]